MEYVKLNNGLEMPMLGFGVFKVDEGQEGIDVVKYALEAGYRSIDTAAIYGNEKSVGAAMKQSGVPRGDIFLTTKLWNEVQRTGDVEAAFAQSLKDLDTDYVDLYLIHWPVKGRYVDSWLALEKIYKSGRAKSIGISNFNQHHIEDIKKVWSVVPVMNQIEMHPRLTQKPLIEFCKNMDIIPQSWSPLGGTSWEGDMRDSLLENDVIKAIGAKYGKSTAQVILRWNIDLGIVTIPKSVTPSRIKDNIDIFDFALTAEDIAAIDALNKDQRVGPDPDTFNF
ncbi:MAG: aldo/keto reductase [Defluviitaleaceae bacterium]|nr:aldo/keto reductase [Defluviitaleaceae bacterium]